MFRSEVPLRKYVAVVTSDTVNLMPGCVGIYVGGAGNITAVDKDNVATLFTAPPVNQILWIGPKRINATATTATLMVALYE